MTFVRHRLEPTTRHVVDPALERGGGAGADRASPSQHAGGRVHRVNTLPATALTLTFTCLASAQDQRLFESAWPTAKRVWVGPAYWANRLQDWQVRDGRLECLESSANKPMRTVHLLTHRLGTHEGELTMTVRTGLIGRVHTIEGAAGNCATGFLVAAGGPKLHPTSAVLVHHNP